MLGFFCIDLDVVTLCGEFFYGVVELLIWYGESGSWADFKCF